MAAQMANVDQAMNILREQLQIGGDADRAFALAPINEEKMDDLPVDYNPAGLESLWRLQTQFGSATNSDAGLRRFLNPTPRHKLPRFDESRGSKSRKLVDDTNLRHLLGCSTQADVDAALRSFSRFDPARPVRVTKEPSSQSLFDNYGQYFTQFTQNLPALRAFGNLQLYYADRESAQPYPQCDSAFPTGRSAPLGLTQTDCVFYAQYRSNEEDDEADYDTFGLLALELKKVQIRATAGLHLSGNCRPDTNDEEGIQAVLAELGDDDRRAEAARINCRETVTQAFQGAVMRKCELIAFEDPAGLCIMSMKDDGVDGLDEALEAVTRDAYDYHDEMTIDYDKVFCVHWEEGSFWKDLTCIIVNQLYEQFPKLKEFLDRYSRLQRGQRVPRGLDQYRSVYRDMEAHQRSHSLYDRCSQYYFITVRTRTQTVFEKFGEPVERDLSDYQVLGTFHESRDDVATSVRKVSHPAINHGRPFVCKLHNIDDKGEELFINELTVYQHLMGENANPRIWPLLLVFVNRTPHYYLALEYLDGKQPDNRECKECAKELVKYGVLHEDVKPSNFVKVKRGRTELVMSIDFGISVILGNIDQSEQRSVPAIHV